MSWAITQLAAFLHRWTIGWFTRQQPPKKRSNRQQRLHLESLEDRRVFAAGFAEFIDPHPAPGNQFGTQVVTLSTGNVVITSPFDDAGGTDAGAVYLFNGRTGELISTLTGAHAGDRVGKEVTALANGNFVVTSPHWSGGDLGELTDAGAVTWASGVTGIDGIVNPSNSLVGNLAYVVVGYFGVEPLANGNYVVISPYWGNGQEFGLGAVTFGNGQSGIRGIVSPENSLVGTTEGDGVGYGGVKALPNGNYVVVSDLWNNGDALGAGAVTFGNGTTGITGAVNEANSLVGQNSNDRVGSNDYGSAFYAVTVLANGNYVISSEYWNNGAGAVTFANGNSGVSGVVSRANSLVGTTAGDRLGHVYGVNALTNGNYVVSSPYWDSGTVTDAGEVTFASGTTGIVGTVNSTNSLVGSAEYDEVGLNVTVLSNGNYVVASQFWNNGEMNWEGTFGAVTFGNGAVGVTGAVSPENSLVGSSALDMVGRVVVGLPNGNYVVCSPDWDNEMVADVGAVTLGNGVTGTTGTVSSLNSLIGSKEGDEVGYAFVLANSNFVVFSRQWDNGAVADAGALTFVDANKGLVGVVSAANSLVGSSANDSVGGVLPLSNGDYVVTTPFWDNGNIMDAGAVTFASGKGGFRGAATPQNSLVGTTNSDQIGAAIYPLANGNYVVRSKSWDNGNIVDAGAVTFVNASSAPRGTIGPANSLVGSSAGDQIGYSPVAYSEVTALSNGNYVVISPAWDNGNVIDAGAVTFGSGTTGITGPISTANSLIGRDSNSKLQSIIVDDINHNFYAQFLADGGGRVRAGSQIDGFSRPWHLANKPADVNNDGQVVAEDVLTIINYINAGHPDDVSTDAAVGGPYGFLDVTGDGHVVAEDVIEVINYINAGHPTEGEAPGQAISATRSAASTPHTESAASVPSTSFAPPVTTSRTAAPDLNESLLLLLASDASLAKKRR